MIKIIISGTYDGFSPRYSTDNILDDSVSSRLLDRRRFLSRDADRLYKEGYSFQPLPNKGILYHKIILLYDGFGRDGFVMASLFLPEGEMLQGKEIKDALDSIISDYKARIQNGIASVELDWTFVKEKADELNTKVKPMSWKKRPSKNDSAKTALIKGVDGRISDYFQYPNPLNEGCSGFGQVFLSESLLDPGMESDDGEQGYGYKVLTTGDVDIDNPEYTIEYTNQQEGARLTGQRSTVTKKELESNAGGIYLGKYEKRGYRPADVKIESGTTSVDGFSIVVSLPSLVQKKASLVINVFGKGGVPIPSYQCEFMWFKSDNDFPKRMQPVDGKFTFLGPDCETSWTFTVKIDSYKDYSGSVTILDNDNQTISVYLEPKPLWDIYTEIPGGSNKYKQSVSEDDLDYYINKAKNELINNGFEVDPAITQDIYSRKVTVVGRTRKKTVIDKDEVVVLPTNDNDESKYYYLRLNSDSKKYLLFRNYREKLRFEKEFKDIIDKLKEEKEGLSESGQNKLANKIEKIINFLKKNNVESAKSSLKDIDKKYADSRKGKEIVGLIKDALQDLEKIDEIKDVVKSPSEVKYDSESHSLVWQRSEKPDDNKKSERVILNTDKYQYTIPRQAWNDSRTPSEGTFSTIRRNLTMKYKLLYWALGIGALLMVALMVSSLFFHKGNEDLTELHSNMEQQNKMLPGFTFYCGDSNMEQLKDIRNCAKKSKLDIKMDSVYRVFDSLFNIQMKYKLIDSSTYTKGDSLLQLDNIDSTSWNDFRNSENFNIMTRDHKEYLDNKWDEKRTEQEQKNEQRKYNDEKKTLYGKCTGIHATIDECKQYINKYCKDNIDSCDQVKGKLEELKEDLYNKCLADNATINLCKKYLSYFSDERDNKYSQVESRKKILINQLSNNQNNKIEETKSSITPKNLNSVQEIFNALTWENVRNGGKKFSEGYKLTEETKNYSTRIANIITRANIINDYNKKYINVKNMTDLKENGKRMDRLYFLEIELGLNN